MEIVRAASAVVVDGAGRVLLVKRGHDPQKGRWSLPGGRLEPGETPAQAAVRELREETGFDVVLERELWTVSVPYAVPPGTAPDRVYRVHGFAAAVAGGSLRSGDDADEAGWFSPAEVVRLDLSDGILDRLREIGVLHP
jgi:8-oxo-dGTP diphosphatase